MLQGLQNNSIEDSISLTQISGKLGLSQEQRENELFLRFLPILRDTSSLHDLGPQYYTNTIELGLIKEGEDSALYGKLEIQLTDDKKEIVKLRISLTEEREQGFNRSHYYYYDNKGLFRNESQHFEGSKEITRPVLPTNPRHSAAK